MFGNLGLRKRIAAMVLRRREAPPPPPLPDDYLDPRSMLGAQTVEQLSSTAEEYFRRVENVESLLAKPFGRAEDTPPLLINFSVALQGLELLPGTRILDFAAGSCWASRIFTQLGCEVVAVDVSQSALDIGRELYRRLPVVGAQPEPQFLRFDGRHFDLPDGSVDRIFCFDAFHHVPNPGEVLREMSRVLAEGGIAAFAEPGPHHSRSPQSQFEMKTFHVLENDLDIDETWKLAQEAGFTELKLSLFHPAPFHVSRDAFDDFLAGGETAIDYLDFVRAHQRNVRDFFLYKGPRAKPDSRRAEGLRGDVDVRLDRDQWTTSERITGRATITNSGQSSWLPSARPIGGVSLGCHLYAGAELRDFEYAWTALPSDRPVEPGETIETALDLPVLPPGEYTLEFDLVSNGVCWFTQANGAPPVQRRIRVGPPAGQPPRHRPGGA